MKTFDEVALTHFHGFTPEQWMDLKNKFPYCEIEFIAKEYASQFIDEAARVAETKYVTTDSADGSKTTSKLEVDREGILKLKQDLK